MAQTTFFLKRQAIFFLIGIVALICCRYFPLRLLRCLAYPLLILAMASLLAIHVSPLGFEVNGAARWLRLGPVSFQPSEFARFALVLYMAYSLSKKGENVKFFKIGFLPHILVLFIFIGLISLQPDFGSVVILGAVTWLMLFVGGVRLRHLIPFSLAMVPLLVLYMMAAAYRIRRLLGFWDPWRYSADEGYQITHSLMAFGTGGIWGAGLGNGYQKLFYLPEPHTDFIFSVIGEELGLWGVIVILTMYLLILWRGVVISQAAKDTFESLIAAGLTIAITLQACVNMGVVMGLLPTKGLTLPFVSYGGTSLVMNMVAIGILMNIEAKNIG